MLSKLLIFTVAIVFCMFLASWSTRYSDEEAFRALLRPRPAQPRGRLRATYHKCRCHPLTGLPRAVLRHRGLRGSGSMGDSGSLARLRFPCTYRHAEEELRRSLLPALRPAQFVAAVDGADALVSKARLWQLLVRTYGRARAATFMPRTYVVAAPGELQRLVREYRAGATYICKTGAQRKQGLRRTRDLDVLLRSAALGYRVVQRYCTHVQLVGGRKLNLRAYVLIVCGSGGGRRPGRRGARCRAYVHRNGKCLYTAQEYDARSSMASRHITSLDVDAADTYATRPLTFAQLREYWGAPTYDHMWARLRVQLRAVCAAARPVLGQRACAGTRFQLFGADLILAAPADDAAASGMPYLPYVLEFNKGPDMTPVNAADRALKWRVLDDAFCTAGLLRGARGGARDGSQFEPL